VFSHIQAPKSLLDNYDELLFYLLDHLDNELTKVRALFMWLISQTLPLTQNRISSGDTPVALLYAIRQRKATYSDVFATLCRYEFI